MLSNLIVTNCIVVLFTMLPSISSFNFDLVSGFQKCMYCILIKYNIVLDASNSTILLR